MAMLAARGATNVSRLGPMDKNRVNLYRDEKANCGCLPQMKGSNKMTKAQLLKERIRQFSIWYFENEDQREGEHVKRRFEREKKRKTGRRMKELRCIRRLFILDGIMWVVGLTLTLCSTVEAIGANTPFYTNREMYRIIGPLTLLLAVILMMTLTGVERRFLKANKMHTTKKRFYILSKKLKKDSTEKESSDKPRDSSVDSGNVEDIELGDVTQQREDWAVRHTENTDAGDKIAAEGAIANLNKNDRDIPEPANTISGIQTSVPFNEMDSGARRKAWSKSKWMRTNIPTGSCDSIEDALSTIDQLRASRAPTTNKTDFQNPLFRSFSSDSEPCDTLGRLEYKPVTSLKRETSSRSKTSNVSNFSNFSETAPLVKR